MKRFLLHGGIRRGVIVTLGCELLFLGIIAAVVTYQVRMVETKITEMADLKDPSPFTARLVGYLNKTNMNLLSYIQNRDDAALNFTVGPFGPDHGRAPIGAGKRRM